MPRRANGKRRYSGGRLYALRLEQQLGEATRRAAKAESALIDLQTKIAEMGQRIESLGSQLHDARKRAEKAEASLVRENQPMHRLTAAWCRIEALEGENRQLRDDAKLVERDLRRENNLANKLRASSLVNLQLRRAATARPAQADRRRARISRN